MSGIALLWRRDGAPAERAAAAAVSERLSHRGPDGESMAVDGSLVLACRHFRTTPEEREELQPVVNGRRMLAFDGRLDNRHELLTALRRDDADGRGLSDAALLLEAFDRWGDDCFERLLGPFAVVVWDGPRRRVVLARDPLGDRTLVYRLDHQGLLVASEEQALLAHPEVSERLDEDRIARYFAVQVPDDGSTFFTEISELRPGHLLSIDRTECRQRRFTRIAPEVGAERLSDVDCTERYLELLTAAVQCRLRSTTPPAVMMSGGLDSTSIAALGARELYAAGSQWRMRAVSWVFDELEECDERRFIDPVLTGCDIDGLQFQGDHAWPLRDLQFLTPNPGTPEANPYRELKQRGYDLAAGAGSRVVLSGGSADVLYSSARAWFADLVREGRLAEAGRSLAADMRTRGLVEALRRAGAGALVRPLRRRFAHSPRSMPWLMAEVRNRLAPPAGLDHRCRRPAQLQSIAGAREARGVSLEVFNANRARVDLRHPYRDRRLVEFMLAIPAHQLYRQGRYKHVARVAARDLLPPEIPARRLPTLLTPLFDRGVRGRETARVREVLGAAGAIWPRYVDRDWLSDILRDGPRRTIDDAVLWHCVSFELWMRRHHRSADGRIPDERPVLMREKTA